MGSSKQKIIIAISGFLIILLMIYCIRHINFYHSIEVSAEIKTVTPDMYQLFYDTGNGFNEKESVKTKVISSGSVQTILFKIPPASVKKIRIDFGYKNKSIIEVKKISIISGQNMCTFGPRDILSEFPIRKNMTIKKTGDHGVIFETTGNDPHIILKGSLADKIDIINYREKQIYYELNILFFIAVSVYVFIFRKNAGKLLKHYYIRFRLNIYAITGDTFFIFVFILMLFIPLLQMYFRYLPEKKINEKRAPVKEPEIFLLYSAGTLDDYFKSFELYYNDHFGLRSDLIYLNSLINIRYFKISPLPYVIIGKDGWLFFDSVTDGVNLKDFYGEALYEEGELDIIKSKILKLKNELKKQNIDFLLVMAPNKHTVYSEFLPDNIRSKKGSQTRAGQLQKIFNKNGINFVDLRDPLLNAKKKFEYPLYYKTDTHWNSAGAYVGFCEITKSVIAGGHKIQKFYDEEKPVLYTEILAGYCDLAAFLNYEAYLHDINVRIKTREKHIKENNAGMFVTKLDNSSYSKVLLYGDSFSVWLLSFFSDSFSRFVFLSGHNIDLNLIFKEKPDIVIVEFVERYSDDLLKISI